MDPDYDNIAPSEESRRFRRALLERIRCELFATAEQEAGPVEQSLLRQVADIIQRCESDLLASFHQVDTSQPNQSTPAHQQATIDTLHPSPHQNVPASHSQSVYALPRAPTAPTSEQHYINIPITAPHLLSEHHYSIHNGQMVWDDPSQTPLSEWIDWNAVFPPGPEGHAQREEALPRLTAPVYT